MTQEICQFVLDCPICQVEKVSHLKPAGKLMHLDVPMLKWEHVVIEFVVGLPVQDECDTIFTVVDEPLKCVTSFHAVKRFQQNKLQNYSGKMWARYMVYLAY